MSGVIQIYLRLHSEDYTNSNSMVFKFAALLHSLQRGFSHLLMSSAPPHPRPHLRYHTIPPSIALAITFP